jgi:hypothetical protein
MGHKGRVLRAQRDEKRRDRARFEGTAVVRPRIERAFPTQDQQTMLLASPVDAAKLQPSSTDLLRLLHTALSNTAGSSAKKHRTETETLLPNLTARRVFDEIKPHLASLAIDDCGVHVVEAIIRAAKSNEADETSRVLSEDCIDALIDCLNESAVQAHTMLADEPAVDGHVTPMPVLTAPTGSNEGEEYATQPLAYLNITSLVKLATHSVGRVLVWAMIECGSLKQKKLLNRELASETLNLVTDRHGIHTVLALLNHYPNSSKTIIPALVPIVASTLLADPVGAKAAAAIISPHTAVDIVGSMDLKSEIQTLIEAVSSPYPLTGESKRTIRFLSDLLTKGFTKGAEDVNSSARAAALVNVAQSLQPALVAMAVNQNANFLVQATFRALGSWSNDKAVAPVLESCVSTLVKSKSPQFSELASHPVAAHVIGCVASCAAGVVSAALRPHLLRLASDKNGSIAIRRIVEQADSPAAVSEALLQAMGQHASTFVEDEHGNLVVQALLKAAKPATRTKFFDSHLKQRLAELCRHRFGAHVVHALVTADGAPLDAAAMNQLFGAIKKHMVELAQHVSGRFVVEGLLSFREAQQVLVDALPQLVFAQGTQGVLTKLYDVASSAHRTVIANYVSGQLANIATTQQGSLIVQKLLARDIEDTSKGRAVFDAVAHALRSNTAVAATLRNDFFGRFVVQIAETGEMPKPKEGSRGKPVQRDNRHAGPGKAAGGFAGGSGRAPGGFAAGKRPRS